MIGPEPRKSLLPSGIIATCSLYWRPPMTEAKQQIIVDSVHPLQTYIVEAVASGYFAREFPSLEFSLDDLQRKLMKDGYSSHTSLGMPLRENQ
jgi:hypothetical protein